MTRAEVYRATLRYFLAPVADLLYEDESVTEVLINGHARIYFERGGRLFKTDRQFASAEALDTAVRNLAEYVHRRLDDRHHSMDARLPEPEQFRVHAVIAPASRQGTCLSIRKFGRAQRTMETWVADASLSPAAAEYLALMVKTHRNVIVAGGTGAGKTSLLNALSGEIAADERIVVIEDSSELRLQQPHVLYLESKPPDAKGKGGATIRDLFVDSLRMRPDRVIVGECRRGEALDLVQSMLSGHDGAISTVHASSPALALVRLETLCMMNEVDMPVYVARSQVAAAIHAVAQVARMADGSRRVVAISEVSGLGRKNRYRIRPVFEFRAAGRGADGRVLGRLEPTGRPSRFWREVRDSAHAADIRLTEDLFVAGAGPRRARRADVRRARSPAVVAARPPRGRPRRAASFHQPLEGVSHESDRVVHPPVPPQARHGGDEPHPHPGRRVLHHPCAEAVRAQRCRAGRGRRDRPHVQRDRRGAAGGAAAPPAGTSAEGALPPGVTPGSAADAKKRLDAMTDRDVAFAASYIAYGRPTDPEGQAKYDEFMKLFNDRYDVQHVEVPEVGFKAAVFKPRFPGDKVIFAPAGTDDSKDLVVDAGQLVPATTATQAAAAVAMGLIRRSPGQMAAAVGQYALSTAGQSQYQGGLQIASALVERYGRDNVMVTGHSLGGGIATYVGAMLGVRAVGFNAAPLGPSNLDNVRRHGVPGAENNITQINVDGELVSGYSPGQQLGEQFTVKGGATGVTSVVGNHLMDNILVDKPLGYTPPRPVRR